MDDADVLRLRLRAQLLEPRSGIRPDETVAPLEVGAPPSREAALAELGRRYLAAYGPAGARDLAAWSGLPAADVQAAWATVTDDLPDGEPLEPGPSVVRLLPRFDTYLLGYRGRDLAVAAEHARRVWPGGGWIHPTVTVDGRVAGTWRLRGEDVAVEAFGPIATDPLEAEIADVRRFRGR